MLIINFEGREAKGLSKGRYDVTFAYGYGVPEGSKSTEVVDHSVYAYFDIHVHV